MKKYLLFFIVAFIIGGNFLSSSAFAQTLEQTPLYEENNFVVSSTSSIPLDNFSRARVIAIIEEGETEIEEGVKQSYQKLEVEITSGNEKGKRVFIDNGLSFVIGQYRRFEIGEIVILNKPAQAIRQDFYYIADVYRLPGLILIIFIFFILAILFGRRRGISSVIGMIFSILVIFYFLIPRILHGGNPLLITLFGSIIILFFSLYLAHGFNKRTSVALLSSVVTLGFTVFINLIFASITKLSGIGTEEAFYLQFDNSTLNLKGVLLSGIIISVLGILDDITTGQTAAIGEISKANHLLPFSELYKRGLVVGREHIASLINTLVLAYVGVSFPLILLFTINKTQPLWMILNSNFISEEILRTIVGSCALILAVPISTLFAAYFFSRKNNSAYERDFF